MRNDPEYTRFVLKSVLRALVYFVILLSVFFIFKYWIPNDWQAVLAPFTSRPKLMFLIFFLSETFFGIIPPELFIIWSSAQFTFDVFVLQVFLFSVLSFIGAFISYFVGTKLHDGKLYEKIVNSKLKKYVDYYHKFGGAIIVISALTPLPFAAISLISGTLGFRFRKYCWFASTRILRFLFYGFVFWEAN